MSNCHKSDIGKPTHIEATTLDYGVLHDDPMRVNENSPTVATRRKPGAHVEHARCGRGTSEKEKPWAEPLRRALGDDAVMLRAHVKRGRRR